MINKNEIMINHHNNNISEEELYGAYKIFFGTLVSQSRLKIINLLMEGKKNVGEIVKELKSDQSLVSHDLARLKKCGFVNIEIRGKYRYYKINEDTIKPLMKLIDRHMAGNCVHILRKENNDHCMKNEKKGVRKK